MPLITELERKTKSPQLLLGAFRILVVRIFVFGHFGVGVNGVNFFDSIS